VSWHGVGIQLGLLASFCFAYGIASHTGFRQGGLQSAEVPSTSWVWLFLCIGIAGTCLQVAGKLSSLDSLGLEGIGRLRRERAVELYSSQPTDSAWWVGLGFLAYPAGMVGCCAVLRWYEDMRRTHVLLAFFFLAGLTAMALFAGGRSALVLVTAVLVSTLALRTLDGRRAIPSSVIVRCTGATCLVGFIAYSMALWAIRSDLAGLDAERYLSHAEDAWAMSVRPGFRDLLEPLVGLEGVGAVVSLTFYLSQSFAVFERIASAPELPVMFGLYQVDALAAGYRMVVGTNTGLLGTGNHALLDLMVYGFFAGAWGGLVIDVGFFGAIAAAWVWGWLAGRCRSAAARCPGMPIAFMLPFWCAASLWSFASSPIGFSNAASLLGWFVLFVACIPRVARSPMISVSSIRTAVGR